MKITRQILHATAGLLLLAVAGCDRSPTRPSDTTAGGGIESAATALSLGGADGTEVTHQDGSLTPQGLVSVGADGSSLTFWPYTGPTLGGEASDPVNLLFVGDADPARIRAALMSLDGDRTAFGFPAAYPFDARWSDAIGDVHATYAGPGGWSGSVIQLQLGTYDPVRFHLRLFRTSSRFGVSGTWTVGAAHFEVKIPGTADHQVLSWEVAEQIVVADLVRSGLLDSAEPTETTDPINSAPGFRAIPSVLYNQLPSELLAIIGGPQPPVQSDVPIPTDGRATVLRLARHAEPVTGAHSQQFTLQYQQVIPKPFCSSGPSDWLLVTGPVTFTGTHSSTADGGYSYQSSLAGRLTATPVDLSTDPPHPVGEPFPVQIEDRQSGGLDPATDAVSARIVRLANEQGGSEFRRSELRVSVRGAKQYLERVHCQ